MRSASLPAAYQQRLQGLLEEIGFSWSRPGALAQAILRLSDFYIANPESPTPWQEAWAQAAYLAYYFPLNYARTRSVMNEACSRAFFAGLESFVEIGSGLGSAQIALQETLQDASPLSRADSDDSEKSDFDRLDQAGSGHNRATPTRLSGYCIERSQEALGLHQRLLENEFGMLHTKQIWPIRFGTDLSVQNFPPPKTRLAILSYVFTEMTTLPSWVMDGEAIVIVEPSTREDGRRLLELRSSLIDKGFHPWAPCTHQGPCPLLTQSQKDWCHDRIEWRSPSGWSEIERLLPMKNRTLTFSYLLMRRSAPAGAKNTARVIGDRLREKGKSRQLICRNSDREFLSWFPQRMESEPELDRGDIAHFRVELEKKSDELRLRKETDLFVQKA